ncbi:helix-turn-helix transcriptional regulator [Streptomyces spectabilis]|uniref:Putative DNA-binding transcriptional regulator YafY n=1 Tax=Streptomyces spectabilis TaxID=68270 RepID=A0A5P2XN18_STRST|nr:WYL domain-containing protein [Streptomyces spectabilis]MBB5104345.1 putative DNA-binding transcriptional regulator YafY [Streptomyces spectabilis]MCI3905296.1 WYL domain-containing protein [Streptomyces spectabilis]QEV64964.1 WYL domain-containing protein [Streptomyces spectabilis]
MKSDRLLSILLLLQTRGQVPAHELAERLEVSVRTIYRDVEALSASGVPVYAERGRHGGIALLPGYRTDVTGLTADESRALFLLAARGAHAALGLDAALGSALRKVMAALPAPHRPAAELTSRRVLVDAERWTRGPGAGLPVDHLGVLQDAVFADRRLRVRYRHSGASEPRAYTLDPYGLVSKAGVWYLVADSGGEPRLFRADRVCAAELTDEPVRRRAGVELAQVWEELKRRVERRAGGVEVTVRVRRERYEQFLRLHVGSLTRVAEDDGAGEWVTVLLALEAVGAARMLLPFAASVEVVSPPEVREDLARAAAAVTDLYRQ